MKIHLIGVGGVAMGNLAAMLKSIGHNVTGSDGALYPPMSDRLRDWGIEARPFALSNIGNSDLYIVGNAISRGNVEVEEVLNHNLSYTSMARAISTFFLEGREVIVVAGTHGKTTTTFLMDHILTTAGRKPGLFAGGVRADGMDGFRVPGKGECFVIEGDEYDTAFFDKHSKFLHYHPRYLILTSVEYDHADIYPDYESYMLSFQRLLRIIPSQGLTVACWNDAGVRQVMEGYNYSPLIRYGTDEIMPSVKAGKTPSLLLEKSQEGEYRSFKRTGRTVHMEYPGMIGNFSLLGIHNTNNALAVALVAERLGLKPEDVIRGLESFPGVLRRQQIRVEVQKARGSNAPIILMEDFAHHPTAVRETLRAVRDGYPGFRIHALFEPRSATSHRNTFENEYVNEFAAADRIYICDIFNKEKVSVAERMNVTAIVERINSAKIDRPEKIATYGENPADLLEKFIGSFQPDPSGDVILVMSNGAFGGIYTKLDQFVKEFDQ